MLDASTKRAKAEDTRVYCQHGLRFYRDAASGGFRRWLAEKKSLEEALGGNVNTLDES